MRVRLARLPFIAKRFDVDAVVEKKLVEVALVAVRFPAVREPIAAVFEFRFVEDALVVVRFVVKLFVEVLFVDVALIVVRAVIVELAETITPTVVVGARYPFTRFQSFPNSEVVAA